VGKKFSTGYDLMKDQMIVYEPIGVVRNIFANPGNPKEIRNSKSQLIISDKYLLH
jgi:hypothetical protein